jgi:hypothetical protein
VTIPFSTSSPAASNTLLALLRASLVIRLPARSCSSNKRATVRLSAESEMKTRKAKTKAKQKKINNNQALHGKSCKKNDHNIKLTNLHDAPVRCATGDCNKMFHCAGAAVPSAPTDSKRLAPLRAVGDTVPSNNPSESRRRREKKEVIFIF